jgi:hypothetical protein
MPPWLRSLAAALLLLLQSTVASYSSEDFRVQGLEQVEPAFGTFQGEMYAGLLPIDQESGGKLMCTCGGIHKKGICTIFVAHKYHSFFLSLAL